MPPPLPISVADRTRFAIGLIEQGQHKQAERLLKEVLRDSPADADALVALGAVCAIQGQTSEAVKHLRRAVRSAPDLAEAHFNLGQALMQLGRFQEAAEALARAASLADQATVHEKLGDCLRQLGRLEDAARHFLRAVDLAPDASLALSSAVETLRKICAWERLAELQDRLIAAARAGHCVEPLLMLHVCDDPMLHRKAAEIYWRTMIAPAAPVQPQPRRPDRTRLRIGYLSADFRQHPMVSVIAEAIELHDRARFEVLGFSYGPDDGSPQRKRMQKAFDRFIDVQALSEHQIAQRIADSGVDILVDLAGYTANARLGVVAARPAPIVCHYMGYPGTLGSPAYDYLIADPIVAPPGSENAFREGLARLSTCYWAIDRKREAAAEPTQRSNHGLPETAVVLASFNGQQKLSPELLDVWARVLSAVPETVLWLYSDHPTAARNLRAEAAARGIANDRIIVSGRVAPTAHQERIRHADLMLDAMPYGGHTTACDALWQGVPVLTMAGQCFAARVGASLATYAKMADLIVPSLEAYERTAIAWARDHSRRLDLRTRLRAARQTAPLFDPQHFCRSLEAAYSKMWQRRLRGESPRSFDVGDAPPAR